MAPPWPLCCTGPRHPVVRAPLCSPSVISSRFDIADSSDVATAALEGTLEPSGKHVNRSSAQVPRPWETIPLLFVFILRRLGKVLKAPSKPCFQKQGLLSCENPVALALPWSMGNTDLFKAVNAEIYKLAPQRPLIHPAGVPSSLSCLPLSFPGSGPRGAKLASVPFQPRLPVRHFLPLLMRTLRVAAGGCHGSDVPGGLSWA